MIMRDLDIQRRETHMTTNDILSQQSADNKAPDELAIDEITATLWTMVEPIVSYDGPLTPNEKAVLIKDLRGLVIRDNVTLESAQEQVRQRKEMATWTQEQRDEWHVKQWRSALN